jgi:hypothetical protein
VIGIIGTVIGMTSEWRSAWSGKRNPKTSGGFF